jgi:hypothetical protein
MTRNVTLPVLVYHKEFAGHGLMDPISFGLFEDKSLVASDARGSPDPIGWGLGCSAVLHVLAALLFVFGLPKLLQAPPPVE